MAKIVYLSDLDIRGSGYKNISVPLCNGLAKKGHDIKVIGLQYKGEEHYYPFSIIPCQRFLDASAMIRNLKRMWQPDVIVASMDIPWHELILKNCLQDEIVTPYVGIFPIEGDPLCLDWAMVLAQMNAQLPISQFGTDECNKMGIPAEHLQIGIDIDSYRLPAKEEQLAIRKTLEFGDMPVILTVADNQERKNLGRAMEIVSAFKKKYKKPFIYALVTREHNEIGFKLRTFASREDVQIQDELRIFERGLTFAELWSLYAVSDAMLLVSKAEGLGMPILESMAMSVPVVATDCTGMHELLADGRGVLVPPEYSFPDSFGNSNRYIVSIKDGAKALYDVITEKIPLLDMVTKAREYVTARNWNVAVETLDRVIRRVIDVQKQAIPQPTATEVALTESGQLF